MIINKIQDHKTLVTLDLKKCIGVVNWHKVCIEQFLNGEPIFREKQFQHGLKTFDFDVYTQKVVWVKYSVDLLVPTWAYTQLYVKLWDYAQKVIIGDKAVALNQLYEERLDTIDWSSYTDKYVLLKGCGSELDAATFCYAIRKLKPYAHKIMYGEACSHIPIWRRKK